MTRHKYGRESLGLLFHRVKRPSWQGSMAISSRYGSRSRKLIYHTFSNKHRAEKVNWKSAPEL